MENPATWTEVQWTLTGLIEEFFREMQATGEDVVCGYSLETRIYLALKEKGLLKDGI